MHLPFYIAKRYLFAKKSHNVINIISSISTIGIAIGTAAMVIILSTYNGFGDLVKGIYANYEADVLIEPAVGKAFSPSAEEFQKIKGDSRVKAFCEIVEENVFVTYDNSQGVAIIKGVDKVFEENTRLISHLIEGDFDLEYGEIPQAVVGRGIAYEMGIRVRFLDPLEIYYPIKGSNISVLNPMASLNKKTLFPVGIVSLEQNFDKKYIFIPIKAAREIIGYEDEVTSLEITLKEGVNVNEFKKEIVSAIGSSYIVKDKYQQNETVYKMMTYEKVAIYMILLFIIILISFNAYGSLSMLIIEKRDDVEILRSMGANESLIQKIFIIEGWLITLLGVVVGVVIGILLCLIQQHFGIIKMPGNFIIKHYPVVINIWDIVASVLGVGVVGLIISLFPVRSILIKSKKIKKI